MPPCRIRPVLPPIPPAHLSTLKNAHSLILAKHLAYKTGFQGDIQPYIYTYRTLNTEHLPPIAIGVNRDKKVLYSYLEYKDEFWSLFENLINEIFDESISFKPATHEDACHYCKFLEFCNKIVVSEHFILGGYNYERSTWNTIC